MSPIRAQETESRLIDGLGLEGAGIAEDQRLIDAI